MCQQCEVCPTLAGEKSQVVMEVEPSDLSFKLRWPSQCWGQEFPEEVAGESHDQCRAASSRGQIGRMCQLNYSMDSETSRVHWERNLQPGLVVSWVRSILRMDNRRLRSTPLKAFSCSVRNTVQFEECGELRKWRTNDKGEKEHLH